MNFSELPPSLRRILAIALLLTAAIGAGAFTLSFVALREVAAQPDAGWGPLAFLFPLIIDGLLVAAEVVLVAASMLGRERLLPLAFVIGAGAVTIWFNITRVPAPVRPVTAIPPIASIAATILIAYLVKILAVALGKPLTYLPPPPTTGVLTPTQLQAPLAGQLTRLPTPPPACRRWCPPSTRRGLRATARAPTARRRSLGKRPHGHLPKSNKLDSRGWVGTPTASWPRRPNADRSRRTWPGWTPTSSGGWPGWAPRPPPGSSPRPSTARAWRSPSATSSRSWTSFWPPGGGAADPGRASPSGDPPWQTKQP